MGKWIGALGLVLLLASFWGGAWLCDKFPRSGAYGMAAESTVWVMVIVSVGVIGSGVAMWVVHHEVKK